MKIRYKYCFIDTAAGLDKLRKLQRTSVWKECGIGYQLVIFRHIN